MLSARTYRLIAIECVVGLCALGIRYWLLGSIPAVKELDPPLVYQPRHELETSGFLNVFASIEPWRPDASLEEYAAAYQQAIPRGLASMDRHFEMFCLSRIWKNASFWLV
jgi:hypothetical protein